MDTSASTPWTQLTTSIGSRPLDAGRRFADPRARLAPTQPRIERVAQAVAQQVEAEHREHDRCARKAEDPPGAAREVLVRIGEHRAPLGSRWLGAESEEAEGGGLEDCERDRERRLYYQWRQAVGHDVAREHAPGATAEASGRHDELLLAELEHRAPAQARVGRDRHQTDR